jgi:hypothetical protein
MRNRRDVAVGHVDDDSPFRTALANVAALQVSGKNDEWIARQNLVLVDMAQGPIVVAARSKS